MLLAHRDGEAAPDGGPDEGGHPAHTVGPVLRDPRQAGDECKDGSQNEGGDGPEESHLVQHLAELRAGLVPGSESFSVRASAGAVDGHNIFDEVVAAGVDLE